jgi:hypothetical protein
MVETVVQTVLASQQVTATPQQRAAAVQLFEQVRVRVEARTQQRWAFGLGSRQRWPPTHPWASACQRTAAGL